MDFDTYETFLENLSSAMRGIDYLIQKAKDERGKRFVWSPIVSDIVEEGALDYVGWGLIYTDIKAIPQMILDHLNDENFAAELVFMNTFGGKYYFLSIGH